MKKLLLLLASSVLAGTMTARQLSPDEALTLALGKMNASQSKRTKALASGFNASRVSLSHTEITDQDVPLYYVYDIAEGGIIIASADDRTSSLLGYTDGGDYNAAMQNPAFMAWLMDCREALAHISLSQEGQTHGTENNTRTLAATVQPLLGEIMWNQDAPYNLLTPMVEGKPDEDSEPETVHAPTGCVATAIAQVMMYYQWPVTGTGSHTNANDSLQSCDFSQSTYQWSDMVPAYEGSESEESQMAVAKLMRDVGCALDMSYDYNGSGANDDDVLRALGNYFGYDKSMRLIYRSECSSEEWNDLLQTELNEQRPVLFGAMAISGGGHEFVIDGYDANGLYHVNWGWGGFANGYFDMNIMDPVYQGIGGFAGGYSVGQVMTLGVKPDVAGTSVAKPELVMVKHFLFDDEEQQWFFKVSNYGLCDFTGEIGLALESPEGEVTRLLLNEFDEEPLPFYELYALSFDGPEVPSVGYTLYPYYSDVAGGEMKHLTTLYNSFNTLLSVEEEGGQIIWDYDLGSIADINLVSIEVKHNYVGFAPQLNFTLSNSADAPKEFAGELSLKITTMVDGEEKLVCSGWGQPFINPGETQEIAIRCNNVEEAFEGKITEGTYMCYLNFNLGGYYYRMYAGRFEMVVTPPSEITYSDFTINKTEFLPDEQLVASMKVDNTGGYDMKSLSCVIFRKSTRISVEIIEMRNVDIEPESSMTLTFKKELTYGPGEYFVVFFENRKAIETSPVIYIDVVNPTAIDKVEAADSKSRIYDLQGRPVQQVRKGELYIGKKFVVVE